MLNLPVSTSTGKLMDFHCLIRSKIAIFMVITNLARFGRLLKDPSCRTRRIFSFLLN
ncbi:hypothetical protein NC653_023083 [Populus alba x Populus x berolinensis]|uniref:Uncharacterized protein n=1 Tax=Populus alba x Populus x berolinensis TaxID=444605 RepID=A0AAD6QBN3_9ROSI|nr:hypothetical protein NC653_023083 [Populus alba x Populus x berolinensis]